MAVRSTVMLANVSIARTTEAPKTTNATKT